MKRLVLLLVLATASLRASNLVMTGGWSQSLSSTDLVSGAGSNFPSTYSSNATALTASVSGAPLTLFYTVYAHVATSSLPLGVTLSVTRTGSGTAIPVLSTVSGGTSPVALTSTDTAIFTGFLDRSARGMTSPSLSRQATTPIRRSPRTRRPTAARRMPS